MKASELISGLVDASEIFREQGLYDLASLLNKSAIHIDDMLITGQDILELAWRDHKSDKELLLLRKADDVFEVDDEEQD